jgi:sulfite exporter TauE/SafE
MDKVLQEAKPWQGLLVGALWGWLPCGMVYTASLSALASGSAQQGALTMLAFGLGTLPNLLAMGAFAEALRSLSRQPLVRWTSGGLICALGLWRLAQVL